MSHLFRSYRIAGAGAIDFSSEVKGANALWVGVSAAGLGPPHVTGFGHQVPDVVRGELPYGVHGATAAVMLATATFLFI
jgi:hypothetical protein